MRVVKEPEERRRELLETALDLFASRGYEGVSMRDVARAAHVTPGLAYHYFDSKRGLFNEALALYAEACAVRYQRVLDDGSLSFPQKLDALFQDGEESDGRGRSLHAVLHAEGDGAFHRELSERMSAILKPALLAALARETRRDAGGLDVAADFLVGGIGRAMARADMPNSDDLARLRACAEAVLAHLGALVPPPAQGAQG